MGSFIDVLFKPKAALTELMKTANTSNGIKAIITFMVVLLIINVIFVSAGAFIEGKDLALNAVNAIVGSISGLVLTVIGLVVTGAIAGLLATKVFKGKGSTSKTIGLVSYAVVPILIISIISNIVALVSSLTANVYLEALSIITLVLMALALLWVIVVGVFAVQVANKTKGAESAAAFIIGLIVAIAINTPLMMFVFDVQAMAITPLL
jgi:hypothetical protein